MNFYCFSLPDRVEQMWFNFLFHIMGSAFFGFYGEDFIYYGSDTQVASENAILNTSGKFTCSLKLSKHAFR